MAGPIVHTVTLELLYSDLMGVGIDISASGNINIIAMYKSILPDIEKVHAYWIPKTEEGNLEERIKCAMEGLSYAPGTYHYNNAIYRICHYVVDCHSIGHFLVGKTAEYLCEPIGELVPRKDSYPNNIIIDHCNSFDEWIGMLYESIRYSYKMYGKNYLFKIPISVRRSVRAGREFIIKLLEMKNNEQT